MSDLRAQLRQLAARGEPRGAEAVVREAAEAAAAQRRNGHVADDGAEIDPTALVTLPVDTSDVDEVVDVDHVVVGMHERRRPLLSPWRRLVAFGGVAALVSVMFVAVTSIGSGGGASSPEGAVRSLANAIDAEDPLAAVDVIAPDEVRSLHDTVRAAERRAAEIKLVKRAGAPLAGVDLQVHDLSLATEQLADGYVKVIIDRGTISAQTHHKQFSPLLQRFLNTSSSGGETCTGSSNGSSDTCTTNAPKRLQDASAEANIGTARPFDTQPFVVTVRRNGHWYVSAAYTALEYARVANNLPAADYGSANAASLGASTPEDAARKLLTAAAAKDWNTVFAMVAPNELPLYDYRAGLGQWFSQNIDSFTIGSLSVHANVHGDTATLDINASGTYDNGDGTQRWELNNGCYGAGGVSLCINELPLRVFAGALGGGVHAQAVRRDGRWFISPMTTLTTTLDQWIAQFDERTLYAIVGDYADIPVDGHLTLGKALTVRNQPRRTVHAYTLDGHADERIVASAPTASPQNGMRVIGMLSYPEGEFQPLIDGEPVTLTTTGTYKVIVYGSLDGATTFTLYDVAHAPKGVVHPFTDCFPVDSSGSSSGATGVLGATSGTAPPAPTVATAVPPATSSSASVNATRCESYTGTSVQRSSSPTSTIPTIPTGRTGPTGTTAKSP